LFLSFIKIYNVFINIEKRTVWVVNTLKSVFSKVDKDTLEYLTPAHCLSISQYIFAFLNLESTSFLV